MQLLNLSNKNVVLVDKSYFLSILAHFLKQKPQKFEKTAKQF